MLIVILSFVRRCTRPSRYGARVRVSERRVPALPKGRVQRRRLLWYGAAATNRAGLLAAPYIWRAHRPDFACARPGLVEEREGLPAVKGRATRPPCLVMQRSVFRCPTWTPLSDLLSHGQTPAPRSTQATPNSARGENFSFLPQPAVFRRRIETFLTRGRVARNRRRTRPPRPCAQASRPVSADAHENSAAFRKEFRSKSSGCDKSDTGFGDCSGR